MGALSDRAGWRSAFAAVVLLGCSSEAVRSSDRAPFPLMESMAIAPLVNLAGYPHAGQIMADHLQEALQARGPRRVVGWSEVVQEGLVSGLEDAPDRGLAVQIGRALGVQAVVYGAVLVYGFESLSPGQAEPSVAAALRVVRVADGEILWAGTARGQGSAWLNLGPESLDQAARQAVAALLGERAKGG